MSLLSLSEARQYTYIVYRVLQLCRCMILNVYWLSLHRNLDIVERNTTTLESE